LRTDASNTGLGFVLYQIGEDGEHQPIEWTSKKLTPTETRYGISEKKMLDIYFGLKRFEYELRGRKFKLETDHKALLEIRKKPQFNNNRINRWIKLIQEFDFSVVYVEGEKMGQADQLSRVNEEDKKKWQKG
ncbi:krab-a domain-containing protein, partial [Pseudoloma neurophilia]